MFFEEKKKCGRKFHDKSAYAFGEYFACGHFSSFHDWDIKFTHPPLPLSKVNRIFLWVDKKFGKYSEFKISLNMFYAFFFVPDVFNNSYTWW